MEATLLLAAISSFRLPQTGPPIGGKSSAWGVKNVLVCPDAKLECSSDIQHPVCTAHIFSITDHCPHWLIGVFSFSSLQNLITEAYFHNWKQTADQILIATCKLQLHLWDKMVQYILQDYLYLTTSRFLERPSCNLCTYETFCCKEVVGVEWWAHNVQDFDTTEQGQNPEAHEWSGSYNTKAACGWEKLVVSVKWQ